MGFSLYNRHHLVACCAGQWRVGGGVAAALLAPRLGARGARLPRPPAPVLGRRLGPTAARPHGRLPLHLQRHRARQPRAGWDDWLDYVEFNNLKRNCIQAWSTSTATGPSPAASPAGGTPGRWRPRTAPTQGPATGTPTSGTSTSTHRPRLKRRGSIPQITLVWSLETENHFYSRWLAALEYSIDRWMRLSWTLKYENALSVALSKLNINKYSKRLEVEKQNPYFIFL